jgi:trk system potassium uptake protein TrkH
VKRGLLGLVVGAVLLAMAALMLIPAAVGLASPTHDWQPFAAAAVLTALIAIALLLSCRGASLQIQPRQAFLITVIVWFCGTAACTLPIVLHEDVSLTDAFFESMSGLTTTGATVFTGLEHKTPAFLLWRSILQWIGGLGFTLMAIAVLPLVGVGGMRLFRSESSDWTDKALPHTRDVAKTIGIIYLALSLLCAIAYRMAGMSTFDAINHAMTTISTGGFSTSDASIAKFASPAVDWVAIVFMLSGALPFMAYYMMLRHGPKSLYRDEQVRAFLWILVAVIAIALIVRMQQGDVSPGLAFTQVTFNIVSVVTTTGFANADYLLWGPFFVSLFFFLTFMGGCSGSTAGGVKIFRIQIAFRYLSAQIRRLVHPRGVFVVKLGGRRVEDDILAAFVAFAFAAGLTVIGVTMALAAMGLDLDTALSAAATALMNVGPGVGPLIGPAGNFSTLPDGAKWILSFAMLLGRLELLTVLVLFSPQYWRA